MSYETHLIDSVNSYPKRDLLAMRCGLVRIPSVERVLYTNNPTKVTCRKCLNYIDNPLRVLRKYGRITTIDGFSIVLHHDWGHDIDLVASQKYPGVFMLYAGKKGIIEEAAEIKCDFSRLPAKVLELYESKLHKNLNK